jgi:predicted HAD superfamily Cof-like phosphohydrolase
LITHQRDVLEFHRAFSLTINHSPTVPPDPVIQLRINLNNDEEAELMEGVINRDLSNCVHELNDIIYVGLGAAIAWGFVIEEHEVANYVTRPRPAMPSYRGLAKIIHDVHEGCTHFEAASWAKDLDLVRSSIVMLLRACYDGLADFGVDMRPFFQEIQNANMGKLWPDGKVHYRADGKVEKPPTYSKEKIKASFDQVLEFQRTPCTMSLGAKLDSCPPASGEKETTVADIVEESSDEELQDLLTSLSLKSVLAINDMEALDLIGAELRRRKG